MGLMARRGKLYQPTQADRAFVERCICAGNMSINEIADCLNITDDTLRKHFRYEIVTGRARLVGRAVGVISVALDDGSVDAAKFVLARQAGWTEKQSLEHTGKDGAPIKHEIGADAAFAELVGALGSVARGQASGAVSSGGVAEPGKAGTDKS